MPLEATPPVTQLLPIRPHLPKFLVGPQMGAKLQNLPFGEHSRSKLKQCLLGLFYGMFMIVFIR